MAGRRLGAAILGGIGVLWIGWALLPDSDGSRVSAAARAPAADVQRATTRGEQDLSAIRPQAIEDREREEETAAGAPEEPAVIVTGRLVAPAGDPVAHCFIRATLTDEWAAESDATTGADGRFELRFPKNPATLAARTLWVHSAVVPVPDALRSGRADVGDVTIDVPPVIAAGRVVGGARGLRGAKVEVRLRDALDFALPHVLTALSTDDGWFEVRGDIERGGLVLVATLPCWLGDAVSFVPGSRNVTIPMTAAGGLAGSIFGFGWSRWYDCSPAPVAVVLAGPGVEAAAPRSGAVRGDGLGLELRLDDRKFEVPALPPGRYSVRFVSSGAGETLRLVEDVVVVAGEVNRDPRLQFVDFSNLVRTLVVTVVDDTGAPIEYARVGARSGQHPDGRFTSSWTNPQGRAVVTMLAGPLEIVAAKRGYRSAELSGVTGDVTIRLVEPRPIQVIVKLAETAATAEPPYRITAQLRLLGSSVPAQLARDWSDPRDDIVAFSNEALDPSVTVTVEEPGVYAVDLWLVHDATLVRVEREPLAQAGGNARVTVGEDRAPQVTVRPDPDDLRRLIERRKP